MSEDLTPGSDSRELAKCPTGIGGFDEITFGGLPRGRASLVCGGPGCGKTLFGMEFLVHGAMKYGEPGVFVSFEETPRELGQNVSSLGWDLASLEAEGKIAVDHVHVERSEILETGDTTSKAFSSGSGWRWTLSAPSASCSIRWSPSSPRSRTSSSCARSSGASFAG